MEKEMIQHKHLLIRGLNIHIAEIGTGAVVVIFLHGFPEIWYSWRYQMIAVANAGCRAIAPDWRGYGLSDQPPELGTASFMDLVHDLLALLDSLAIPKAFLVAKDFGVLPAQYFALLHPERVTGVITLGVPLIIPSANIVNPFLLPSGFYMRRWQEPGRAEADFGRFDTRTVVRNIYILFSGSQLPVAGEDQEIMDLVDPSTPLPQWFTDEDLTTYTTLYENSKFSYPLQVPYRTKKAESEITDLKFVVPAMLIMGEKDYLLKFPGMEEYIRSGKMKEYVSNLEVIFMPEGSHFVQEQFPDQVNQFIMTFIKNHT